MADFSADNLRSNLTNPAKTYNWDVIFPNPVGGGSPQTLQIRCQSTSIPGRSFGTIEVPYKATAGVVYLGKMKYDHTWPCTFIEGEDKSVFNAIHNWQQAMIDDVSGLGAGDSEIKIDVYLNLTTTKGESYMKLKMIGCMPIARDSQPLAYGDEGQVMYNVTFSYDRWEDA